jgi:transposase InsO family protein
LKKVGLTWVSKPNISGIERMDVNRALADHAPEIHHSDQGIQYAVAAYIQMLRAVDAEISIAEIGEAWQNGYAERLIRTIKEEEVDLSDYECNNDAVFQLGRFLNDVYMHKRIHSSLGYLTPAEFEEQWRSEREQPLDVHQKRLPKCPVSWGQHRIPFQWMESEGVKSGKSKSNLSH